MEEKTLAEMNAYFQETIDSLLAARAIDPMEMFRELVALGKDLQDIQEEERTAENFVHGCVSNVYIVSAMQKGRIYYRGTSDAHIVRGYLTIMVQALSGLQCVDIVDNTEETVQMFARETGLKALLTPTRANAFGNIYAMMVNKAKVLCS